jgi:uncharacterized protein YggL (DUF469 family)
MVYSTEQKRFMAESYFRKVARLTMSGINQCNIACKIGSMKRKKVTEGQQNVFQKWLMQLRK